MITHKEVKVNDFEISLSKLTGKKIKDIRGYISREFGSDTPVFAITSVVLENDKKLSCEGEHDIAYIPEESKAINMDNDTLRRLYQEANGKDEEEEAS